MADGDFAAAARAEPLRAPFPWMGGKSRVAHVVWDAFGNVPNYVEPFFGSGAVLLARPHSPGLETVNDEDGFVANFFRAIKKAPSEVAEHADCPVNENDLHARHIWLVNQRQELTRKLEGDPEYYDAKIAGWWVWGLCCWIGGGWCSGKGQWQSINGELVNTAAGGAGINRKIVHLGDAGRGVNRKRANIESWFVALSDRLRNVRVCCGDWARVCGPSPTFKNGMTGVFLDPPYGDEANRTDDCYAIDSKSVAAEVRAWCLDNGGNPMLRIALCGYDGEHNSLTGAGWREHAWKAHGGYGSLGDGAGRENARRERIWFSPHCMNDRQMGLFR